MTGHEHWLGNCAKSWEFSLAALFQKLGKLKMAGCLLNLSEHLLQEPSMSTIWILMPEKTLNIRHCQQEKQHDQQGDRSVPWVYLVKKHFVFSTLPSHYLNKQKSSLSEEEIKIVL